jgi:hypothetical protein
MKFDKFTLTYFIIRFVRRPLKDLPAEYSVKGMPDGLLKISSNAKYEIAVNLIASWDAGSAKFIAEINDAGKTLDMQLGIIALPWNAQKTSVPGEK